VIRPSSPPQHPRYEVLEHLGRGAVGDIYRVQDRDLGRRLALKVLRPAHLSDANLIEHLREESRLCSQLPHPGVVPSTSPAPSTTAAPTSR
jgi:serine/threonine protein kinase